MLSFLGPHTLSGFKQHRCTVFISGSRKPRLAPPGWSRIASRTARPRGSAQSPPPCLPRLSSCTPGAPPPARPAADHCASLVSRGRLLSSHLHPLPSYKYPWGHTEGPRGIRDCISPSQGPLFQSHLQFPLPYKVTIQGPRGQDLDILGDSIQPATLVMNPSGQILLMNTLHFETSSEYFRLSEAKNND